MKLAIQSALVCATMTTLAHAQAPDSWIGKRVFTQYGAVLKVGNVVVDDEGRSADMAASGKARRSVRTYRVERVNGEWLWLKDEKSRVAGWVQSKWVVPYEQAIEFYTNQIRANPSSVNYIRRGTIWSQKGEYDIAIGDYNEAIRLDPSSESAYCARGYAWGNKKDYEHAIADYNEAIRLDPKDAWVYNNRGSAWGNKKDYEHAIADYNEAIRLDPKYASAYHNRGIAWSNKKDYEHAIADYNEAIRLDPKYVLAYYNRGNAWDDKKDYDHAIADYNEAIRLDPKDASPYNGRAWLWATASDAKFRDGKKAVESATKACELSEWKERNHLGTLAACYAEAGDFDEAVKWEEAAIKLTPESEAEEMKGRNERLALYRDKKPYRQP
jgi:tetratricopeptide (TPR) repeat protein